MQHDYKFEQQLDAHGYMYIDQESNIKVRRIAAGPWQDGKDILTYQIWRGEGERCECNVYRERDVKDDKRVYRYEIEPLKNNASLDLGSESVFSIIKSVLIIEHADAKEMQKIRSAKSGRNVVDQSKDLEFELKAH